MAEGRWGSNPTPPTYHSQTALGYCVPKMGRLFALFIVSRPIHIGQKTPTALTFPRSGEGVRRTDGDQPQPLQPPLKGRLSCTIHCKLTNSHRDRKLPQLGFLLRSTLWANMVLFGGRVLERMRAVSVRRAKGAGEMPKRQRVVYIRRTDVKHNSTRNTFACRRSGH